MRAELRRLHSPDVQDLPSYVPEVRDSFGFLLQVMIGPEGLSGEESFDVFVCTPEHLKSSQDRTAILSGRHHLVVQEYDYERLLSFLRDYCAGCSGNGWQQIARELSRLGKWEFEDYKP